MAKKKADEVETPGLNDFGKRVVDDIEREYGKGHVISGNELADQPKVVVPISPSMDLLTNGGIQEGSWVGITGPEKLGKTVLALTIAANAQRPEFGGRTIFFANVEHRLSKMHLRGIQGLDLSEEKFKIIKSRKGQILSSQKWLNIFSGILRDYPNAVLIIDSLSAMCEERVLDDGVGTETRSSGYRLISQFLDMMAPVVPINNSIVIGITRMIANTSGMGHGGKVEKSPNAWRYQMDYQLRGVMKAPWLEGGRRVGQVVTWQCNCSKLGPPGGKIESRLRYGIGLDGLYELASLGASFGLVTKSGSWYSLDYLDMEQSPKAQGAEGVRKILMEHPEWAALLKEKLSAFAGTFTGGDEE